MDRKKNLIFIIVICAFFLIMPIADIVTEDRLFSPVENRLLAKRPEFSTDAVIDKSYMNEYESYITDQFPARDSWVTLKTKAELALQKKDVNGIYISEDNYLIEQHTTEDVLSRNPQEKAEKLTALLKQYGSLLGEDRVKAMLVPTADNVLTEKLPPFAEYFDQKAYIEDLASETNQVIDVTDTLREHREEYIYYKTDHHWTTLGAYYAYAAWAEEMGFEPKQQEDFEAETVTEQFYGTLYSKLNIAKEADSINLYLPKEQTAYEVYYDLSTEAVDTLYERKHLDTKNKYAVFLDDNHPFIRIHTENTNDRNLLLIKDSYANCFVPFAVNHYENVYMIDLRYYMGDIESIVEEYEITDMLVLYDVIHFIENYR